MRLARMGSFHQSRLSFMRVLLRNLKRDGWRFERPRFDIDARGVGVAEYRACGPKRTYTLIAFAHDLPADKRSDRVIAEAWDATFALYDGVPTKADIDRLAANVPLQEAGRVSERELVLSRANRSVRLFDHVIERLAAGQQPDPEMLRQVGYLMRTTAVYGSGKFGAADRETWAGRSEFAGSFQPEMLSVWLTRAFTVDLVEHLARLRAPATAVAMQRDLKRRLGVGNSTGLGMAPFLINHPALIHAWINARETALARVRAVKSADDAAIGQFKKYCRRALINAKEWHCQHQIQRGKITELRADLTRLIAHLDGDRFVDPFPWDRIYRWSENSLGLEAQEQVISLLLEPYGELVDDLAADMSADEQEIFRIDGAMTLGQMRSILQEIYGWAIDIDFIAPEAQAMIWYVSEEKLEPRLGTRFGSGLEPYEQPLAQGRDAAALYREIAELDGDHRLADFLMQHPEHRHIARRAQLANQFCYAEIRDNTISHDLLPIDLLRCKLSFFGATKFDPRSDRWVRITMYQDAPFPDELAALDPDELAYPQGLQS